jgi:hypothetical protein
LNFNGIHSVISYNNLSCFLALDETQTLGTTVANGRKFANLGRQETGRLEDWKTGEMIREE